ncbi:MAG: DUF5703 domain-containing protein [Tannerellaceae bacterium]|nr:DUF5703 domain-containing protein [Tannerellaceae bacterium]
MKLKKIKFNQTKNLFITLFLAVGLMAQAQNMEDTPLPPAKYNVVWDWPGKDAASSMPIGNVAPGANVYTVANGDLYLLLGKTDAFDRLGNVLKTGRVRIRINPRNTVIEGTVRKGKLISWTVTPAARKKDVIIPANYK